MVWLVNQLYSWAFKKSAAGFKEKVVSLFKTNTSKQTVYGIEKKLSKPKTRNTRNRFISKKKKKIKIE